MKTIKKAIGSIGTVIKRLNAKRKKLITAATSSIMTSIIMSVSASAESEGVEEFNVVIDFFAVWIGRIGLIIGFVGAIMFGFAIKNDDADAKQRGLMTLGAGFVVFALTKALDMFMQ